VALINTLKFKKKNLLIENRTVKIAY